MRFCHISLSLLFIFLACACSQKFERVTVFLRNTADINFKDAPIVIPRSAFHIQDSTLIPIIVDEMGNYIPCQSDDINQDGIWDELVFVYDFGRLDSLRVYVEWMKKDQFPAFAQRTNLRIAKRENDKGPVKERKIDYHTYDLSALRDFNPYQMEGPAWENDKIGFRHAFDGTNTHSMLGKRSSRMVLDSIGIMPDGNVGDTYHVLAGWGMDLLDAANTTGIGGISLLTDSTHIRLGVAREFMTDNIDSSFYTVIAEGPIRSILRMDYKGWQTGKNKMDLTQYIMIWAGQQGYHTILIPHNMPDSAFLATGIPIKNLKDADTLLWDSNLNFRVYEEGYVAMMTHAMQSPNDQYALGMALVIPKQNFKNTFRPDILKQNPLDEQWSAALKSDDKGKVNFYVMGCWELENEGFKSADYFVRFVDDNVIRLNHPIEWKLGSVKNTLPPVISRELDESL